MINPDTIFSESIDIKDAANAPILSEVFCSTLQGESWMRDPAGDVAFYANYNSDVTSEWDGTVGSVRVNWHADFFYWCYAIQFYEQGQFMLLICAPPGSPSLYPVAA